MQLGTPDIISKSQRERPIMPNIAFQHFFKRKIKKKIFEFEEELSFFKTQIEIETTLENKNA